MITEITLAMDILGELMDRYPVLNGCQDSILEAFDVLCSCFDADHMLYICGNGGSAADAEHIVGEMMKSFTVQRRVSKSLLTALDDPYIGERLEGALRAVALPSSMSLTTAFANDVAPDLIFAQQVYGYGRPGDVLWGISTSGNSANILHALKVARAKGMATIGLSGATGGDMKHAADVCICVPESETYKIQELHLPVYHALCRMLEAHYFAG